MSKDYKELLKKYGDVIKKASYILEEDNKIVPVGPAIDMCLGGGIEEGTWTMLSGAPKCGKTTTALQIAKNAIELYDKPVFYFNVEGRFKKKNAKGIKGLDPEKIEVITSETGNILSAEKYLTIGTEIVNTIPGCVLIIDSVSQLCSAKELSEDISGQSRSLGPRIMSSFCKQLGGVVPIQKTIVIMINHLIANTSGFGSPYMEDGGRKSQYQIDNKLRQKLVAKWKEGDEQIGQIVTWDVVEASLCSPGTKAESCIRYGVGIDAAMEWFKIGVELGAIKKKGAWYYMTFMGDDIKFQGGEAAYAYLSNTPEATKALSEEIMALQ